MTSPKKGATKGETKASRSAGLKRLRGGLQEARGSWISGQGDWMRAIIVTMTELEGAVIFGKTRDGGALTLTLLLDGDKNTYYIKPSEDIDVALEAIHEELLTLQD